MSEQPDYFIFNETQEYGIVASDDDALWINLTTKDEVDIDDIYNISSIRALEMYNKKFYVLANKYQNRLGYYLLELDVEKPKPGIEPKFIIRFTNKLDISDAALHMINLEREDLQGNIKKKVEIVASYKINHVNKYVIHVISIESSLI